MLLDALVTILISVAVLWLVLVVVLLVKRPDRATIRAASKLPRDLLAMAHALLRDDQLPHALPACDFGYCSRISYHRST